MSFVEVQPSESILLKVRLITRSKIDAKSLGRIASVITTESIVARAGASIPAPFAIPIREQPSTSEAAIFGTESVVMIAWALLVTSPLFRSIARKPLLILSIGKNSPIIPVEQTMTSPEEISNNVPTSSAVTCVSRKPCGPVHAFAPPELRTTARTSAPLITSLLQITGAAMTLLVVNTAVASKFGPWFSIIVRSSAPEFFSPAATAPPLNPLGKFMLTNQYFQESHTSNSHSVLPDSLHLYPDYRLQPKS